LLYFTQQQSAACISSYNTVRILLLFIPLHLLMLPLVGAAQAVLIFNLHCRSQETVQRQGVTKLQA
jgi:hypothetical protein